MQQAEIGIIGGSGLYHMPGFNDAHEVQLQTPFGDPSDAYILGTLDGRKVRVQNIDLPLDEVLLDPRNPRIANTVAISVTDEGPAL